MFVREENTFRRTLTSGLHLLDRYRGRILGGADIFLLADTHGFPKELTVEISRDWGIELAPHWEDVFSQLREQQRQRSRG